MLSPLPQLLLLGSHHLPTHPPSHLLSPSKKAMSLIDVFDICIDSVLS